MHREHGAFAATAARAAAGFRPPRVVASFERAAVLCCGWVCACVNNGATAKTPRTADDGSLWANRPRLEWITTDKKLVNDGP